VNGSKRLATIAIAFLNVKMMMKNAFKGVIRNGILKPLTCFVHLPNQSIGSVISCNVEKKIAVKTEF